MDFWFWYFVAAAVLVGVGATSGWWAFWAYRNGQFGRAWRWLRVLTLGGATTLDRDLDHIACTLCLGSFDAGEKVRTLSCDHVFHRGGISKCEDGIDNWLRTAPRMTCPSCFETPRPVLPPWSLLGALFPPLPPPSESSSGLDDRDAHEALFPPLLPPSESSSGLDDRDADEALFPPLLPPPESSSGLDDRDAPLLPRSETA